MLLHGAGTMAAARNRPEWRRSGAGVRQLPVAPSASKVGTPEGARQEGFRQGYLGGRRSPTDGDRDAGSPFDEGLAACTARGRSGRARAHEVDPLELGHAIAPRCGESDPLGAEPARPVRVLDVAAWHELPGGCHDAPDGEAGFRNVGASGDRLGQRDAFRVISREGIGEEGVQEVAQRDLPGALGDQGIRRGEGEGAAECGAQKRSRIGGEWARLDGSDDVVAASAARRVVRAEEGRDEERVGCVFDPDAGNPGAVAQQEGRRDGLVAVRGIGVR